LGTIFADLEMENAVQLLDKTRFSAVKSFVAKGTTAITTLTIKAGADGSATSVYDSTDQNQWYLDWKFTSLTLDIDATNNKIDFSEGGSVLVATLTSGSYTLSQLATEVQTQLDSAGSLTYTCSYDADDKLTISATGGFNLLGKTGENVSVSILANLGFEDDQTGKSTYTAKRTEYLVKKITAVAGNGSDTSTVSEYIKVFSVLGDRLFSNDTDLTAHEPDVLRYVPEGHATFNNIHRRAQDLILRFLDDKGYVDINGEKFQKAALVDLTEVQNWSTMITLRLIFEGLSNAVDDVFSQKAQKYKELELVASQKTVIRLDVDGDEVIDIGEQEAIGSGTLVRR